MRYVIKRNDNKYLAKLNSFIYQDDNEWVDDISEALELTIGKCDLFINKYNTTNYSSESIFVKIQIH